VETLLVEDWFEGAATIRVLDTASVSVVREHVRERASQVGLPAEAAARLVNVASELAANQLAHARAGEVAVVPVERDGVVGLEVRAADAGEGIAEPVLALRGGHSTAGTLGVGLAAVLELADEVDVDTRLLEGTCFRARVFERRLPGGREVGIVGRPIGGERVSGDDLLVRRVDGAIVVAALDGLGHGPEARYAALVAKRAALAVIDRAPEQIIASCHVAAAHTRGVAMTVARVERDRVQIAGLGNVAACVVGPTATKRFGGVAGVVGAPGRLPHLPPQEIPLAPLDALILYTDGVSSRAGGDEERGLLAQRPVILAASVLGRYGRGHDDALVAVVR
jgi:anti-sigma regulatory factor (Ser/Thr protein kinase)